MMWRPRTSISPGSPGPTSAPLSSMMRTSVWKNGFPAEPMWGRAFSELITHPGPIRGQNDVQYRGHGEGGSDPFAPEHLTIPVRIQVAQNDRHRAAVDA